MLAYFFGSSNSISLGKRDKIFTNDHNYIMGLINDKTKLCTI